MTVGEMKNIPEKFQALLNKFAEKNRNLSLCKQFLEVLRDWDFNKPEAEISFKEKVSTFLNNIN